MSQNIDRQQFMDQGFLILRNLFTRERIERLRATHEVIVDRQRERWAAERGPDDPAGGVWDSSPQPRVLVNAPGLVDAATAEAIELWIDDELLGIANRLLAVPEASVTEFMLMCNPSQRDFGPSDWHRDINAADMAPLQRLIDDMVENGPRYVQWNIPLYDDDVLWVVPGSHRRTHGKNEREWSTWHVKKPLPGAIPVELRPGDAVVYINYILHWGSNYSRKIRRTIHGGHSCFTSHRSEPFPPHLSAPAQRHFAEGHEIVLIGHRGHPEVVGTMGQLPEGAISLVETVAAAELFVPRDPASLAFVTQTTLSVDDTSAIVMVLKRRFPAVVGPHKEDICYATTNRQEAVKRVAPTVDAMIVVGSPNSSNSVRLVEVAQRAGCARSMLVERASEIDWGFFAGIGRLGVTAGASAPETLVDEIIEAFAQRYDIKVAASGTQRESIVFNLPRELRSMPPAA